MSSRVIATEEAFATSALVAEWRRLLADGARGEPGLDHHLSRLLDADAGWGATIRRRLLDLGEGRAGDMDEAGVDMQVIGLTGPGVQVFAPDTAHALAIDANDVLLDSVRAHPSRFAGLAAVAPHHPSAADELARAVRLGLRGAIVNSHTGGEYLDEQRFWPLLEAAESLRVPIYLHPRTMPGAMREPFAERHLDGAFWGFHAEVALHALRLIVSGVFDRFPGLQIVLGHLGEGLPFWLDRLDRQYRRMPRAAYPRWQAQRLPGEYFLTNLWVTSSGHNWDPAVRFVEEVVGPERLLFAADHPYEDSRQQVEQAAAIDLHDPGAFFAGNAVQVFGLD